MRADSRASRTIKRRYISTFFGLGLTVAIPAQYDLTTHTGGFPLVRMIVPPVAHRREIDRNLGEFFRNHRAPRFNRAISLMCRYFNVRRPRIEWFEYIDWGKTAGRTYEDGRIHLVHPENWKRGGIYFTEGLGIEILS